MDLKGINKMVVKVGTSTLAHSSGLMNIRNIEALVKVLSDIKNMGVDVILVSSGAIGIGFGKLGITNRPTDIPSRQAAAAVGQSELMHIYDKLFGEYSHTVAQVLLTGDDLNSKKKEENVTNTFLRLSEMHALPIINENDTVATEEIVFGDNDMLSALVAKLVKADILVILSDIDGLYSANPRTHPDATLVRDVYNVDESVTSMADTEGSSLGRGGMTSKIQAAAVAVKAGVTTYVIHGSRPERLYGVLEGNCEGTTFHASKPGESGEPQETQE